MTAETSGFLQLGIWCCSFWTVVFLVKDEIASRQDALRLIASLSLGAGFAHLGSALVGPSRAATGFSILFVPLGVLLVGAASGSPRERSRFLHASLPALPPAFALARAGCLLTGCCLGATTGVPWAVDSPNGSREVHPFALYEITLLMALHGLLRAVPSHFRAGLSLSGMGLIRIVLEPLRSPTAGEPLVSASWIAGAWMLLGIGMLIPRQPRLGTAPG